MDTEYKRDPDTQFEILARNPEKFAEALNHITMGGTLPDWCSAMGLRYSQVLNWIRNNDDRRKAYKQALDDRQEWAKDSVYARIKDMAMQGDIKPELQLRALEILAKTLGMFTEKHEHTGKLTLEDLIERSRQP